MEQPREKLKSLIRTLFQFESADLDFGIYRIMNYKRDVIENFIEKGLIDAIANELKTGILSQQSQSAAELQDISTQIRETLGENALNDIGGLDTAYHNTPLGKRYLDLQTKASDAKTRPALEAIICNHLYAFLSRYYDSGDFISKRRYGRKEKYAIPYNGEEVHLHWANNDQYYIKAGEFFTNYSFKALDITAHFRLENAQIEKDNVKGEKQFFVPLSKKTHIDEHTKDVVIPFEYRSLTGQEQTRYGQRNQQENIIADSLETIPNQLKKNSEESASLFAEHHKSNDGKIISYLEHHLRQYTRRNTSDFFIHKDLKGFLIRELDFYIKNEVVNIDELEAAGEIRAESWFQIMRVIKAIGGYIIEFLAQIEDFQKMLFEKKKFVVDTRYCITVGNIDCGFYSDIAACEQQWTEWKALFHIDAEQTDLFSAGKSKRDNRIAFLKAHPTLVLDTKHFSPDFSNRLLANFDDIDNLTDGLLIHGENFQSLNLILEKYREKIKCIHIDPPYNTQTSGFLYKNDYQHSSWLTMMENRINAGATLMSRDGAFLCHIDENEYEALHLLFSHLNIPDGGTIVWDKKNPMLGRKGVATQHEYILWRSHDDSPIYLRPINVRRILAKADSIIRQHGGVTDKARREFSTWINTCDGLSGGERAYRLINDDGRVFQSVAMGAPEPRTDQKFHVPLIHPVTKKKCPVPSNGWSRTPEHIQDLITKGEIIFGENENVQPRKKVFLTDDSKRQLSSVISDASRGKMDVEKLGLEFPYCHPVSLYEELLGAAVSEDGDIVIDYFAGSGTNGHAVINLNREDGVRRRFILVEMGSYFETVLIPRIKKVIFTPEWKDGKPRRQITSEESENSPRIIKVLRVESYEDTLNNIEFDELAGQAALKFDDYILKYMLKWEAKSNATLLNVEKLKSPFSYKLNITNGQESHEKIVDIPETFSYLMGLHIKTCRIYDDGESRYLLHRGQINHCEVVVIWRDTTGWEKKDYERDKKFVAEQKFAEGADEVFVNGDSLIPSAKSLDGVFKARMFTGV